MRYVPRKLVGHARTCAVLVTMTGMAGSAGLPSAHADEAQAKDLLQAMSNYLAAQTAISFEYDSSLEVVTTDDQKIAIASSGSTRLNRPDKLRATRVGGFANVEMIFDGTMLTLLGKNENAYLRIDTPGTIDHLVDVLRDEYGMPLPAADLLMSDVYDELMPLIVDVKDLGSGVIRGVECDHLAFRTEEADFQIWIAQGDRPYPCRYVITTSAITGWPQYSIDVMAWKTGTEVASDDFTVQVPADAKKLNPSALAHLDELPNLFVRSGAQ